jgi:Bifunctional DNA primase/polymerase, N-terminal
MSTPTLQRATYRDTALRFHDFGLNVIANRPGTKTPCHIWKGGKYQRGPKAGECGPDWTQQQQTRADVIGLPWRNAGALGLVNGPGGLRTFDFDKCPDAAPVKAALAAMDLPDDYAWQGRSGSHNGYGLAVICDELPPGLFDRTGILIGSPRQPGDFHQLELRAWGCQTIVAPSLHKSGNYYEWLYGEPSAPPTRVSADQLMAGFLAVAELTRKEAPAPRADQRQAAPHPTGERRSGESPIDAFNQTYTAADAIEMCGGTQTRDAWSCNEPSHNHSNENNLLITSRCLILAYGPNCYAPQNLPGAKALTPFGYFCEAAHGGNVKEAVKAAARLLNMPAPERTSAPQVERQAPAQPTDAERAAYNAARREKRYAENRQTLDTLTDRIGDFDFTNAVPRGVAPAGHAERAAALAYHLIGLAHRAGVLQVRPTNEQLTEALDFCERYVQYAFRELEAAGLGKRHGGRGGLDTPNEAAIWTFFRSPSIGCKPRPDAVCDLVIYNKDLINESDHAREGGAASVTERAFDCYEPALADDWLWLETEQAGPEVDRRELLTRVRLLARVAAEPDWYLRDYAAWATSDLEIEVARLARVVDHPTPAARPPVHWRKPGFADDDQPEIATYTPLDCHERQPHAPHKVPAWLRVDIGPTPLRSADADEPVPVPLDLPDEEPLVRCVPTDPIQQARYYKLRGKAKKAASAAQRRMLNDLADALMVWLPASERGTARASPPLTSPSSVGIGHRRIEGQQSLWSSGHD